MASVATAAPAAAPPAKTAEGGSRAGRGARITLFYLLLLVIAVVFITPYLFSIFAAFKPLTAILSESPARPPTASTFTLENFKDIFTQYDFGRYLANTLIVTVILTAGQVTFSLMGAYAFARMEF